MLVIWASQVQCYNNISVNVQGSFLRFGISINEYERVYPFIEKAKSAGVMTCCNFMKSHLCEPIVFEKAARATIKEGADVIYIVDSAGSMTPNTVRQYCERVKDLPFGFHGHNNLGLAVANADMAGMCGASIVDCSIQGMGRSSGNTMTEHFLALKQRDGLLKNIDLLKILDLSENLVRPLLSQIGHSSIDIISGIAGFHSSYMNIVKKYSQIYSLDPRLLIIEACKYINNNFSEDSIEKCAQELSKKSKRGNIDLNFEYYHGNEQSTLP